MSLSYTISESKTFTITDAVHIAAKVATDLKRLQRFYGRPTDAEIEGFEIEVTQLLKAGYLDTVSYGYRRGNCRIPPTLIYKAKSGKVVSDSPGGIIPGENISGASFYSFLIYNTSWHNLSQNERNRFMEKMPFHRSSGPELGIDGYLDSDRAYSAGGISLNRGIVKGHK